MSNIQNLIKYLKLIYLVYIFFIGNIKIFRLPMIHITALVKQ